MAKTQPKTGPAAAVTPSDQAAAGGEAAAAANLAQAGSGDQADAADEPTTQGDPPEGSAEDQEAHPWKRGAAPAAAPAKPAGDPFTDLVPEAGGRKDEAAFLLLLEACERYGVDPRKSKKPVELLSWRFYPGSYDHFATVPDAVVFVTSGGMKIKHFEDPAYPMDADTLERLRRLFDCYKQDPKTKEITVQPLPADVALPAATVTGAVLQTDHVYQGGYLKSGGKSEAERRDERRAARAARFGK